MCNLRAWPQQLMLEEVYKRIQHCCATLRRSQNKRNVGSCWLKTLLANKVASVWTRSKGWRSGESVRLSLMWPGFKSRRRCHNVSWVCSERFFCRYSAFPLSSKTNISKFQFQQESGRRRTTLWMCYLQIIIYLFYWSIFLFNISWPSFFSGCQFVLFLVLRHSAVHSAIVLLLLVWLRSRREKCKNRSVFWVSEYEWKTLFTHCTWIKWLYDKVSVLLKSRA